MSSSPIYLELLVGKGTAAKAPAALMRHLVQAKVDQGDRAPSGFQLVFESPLDGDKNEFSTFNNSLLATFNRAALSVIVGDERTVLIDGYITNKEIDPSSGNVTITGEDMSVKMDLFQLVGEYKASSDTKIAKEILRKYQALGITPKVKGPSGEVDPTYWTPTQRDTDRVYLQRLAQKNNVVFYLQPGKKPGDKSTAYWGPPVKTGRSQKAISARVGGLLGHVDEFSANYDSLAATMSYGEKMTDGGEGKEAKEARYAAPTFKEVALGKDSPDLSEFTDLATSPEKARGKITKLSVRGKYLRQLGLQPGAADVTAQAGTDTSTAASVTLTGTLDTVNYGAVLRAPGLVGVRGAGASFSGEYYVKKVTHSFNLRRAEMKYTQSFTLTREGLGAKSGTV